MGTYGSKVGNQEFQSLETGSSLQGEPWFQGWEPGVPISGNREFLAMGTYSSKVGNQEFQSLGTEKSLLWEPIVPKLGTRSSNL